MTQSNLDELEIKKVVSDYNKQERRRLFKIFCWFAMSGMPAGISLDMQVYPTYAPYFLKVRLFSSLLVGILYFVYYRPWAVRFDRILFFITLWVPQGFITWMIYSTEGAVSPYYAGLNVVIVAFCLLLSWTFQETLLFSLTTIVFYVIACMAHGPIQNAGIFFNNMYFLFLTSTFAVVGSYFTNKLRTRETVLRFELDYNRKQLEESNRKLVELDRMKSQFFANISHELRTPLTLLIAPLETLQKEKGHLFDEEMRTTVQMMRGNAMRLLKLINDLLDLVKLESGRMEVTKEPIQLEEFLRGLVQSIQGTAKDKGVQLSSEVAPDLGVILADSGKLEKIILNLLFNSVKFTPASGKVELSAVVEGHQVVLRVRDTGMGISSENLPHIFDRFWQADSSAQRKYQGTGIGLALVKELTEAQGGTVAAESEVGKGTTITIRIPLEKTDKTPTMIKEKGDPALTPTTATAEWLTKLYHRANFFPSMTPLSETLRLDDAALGRKPKVLVADDEPDMLRFIQSQLGKNYEVLEAVDGNQAWEKARQYLPDLVILDMMMPEKNGVDVCRELKAHTSTQAIPVILLTARADEETKMASLNAGASDFLTKPFSTTELHLRVKNLVESHQSQRDLSLQKSALESTLEQLKETEGQLVQSEKMASLGRLSAGIIHEINNPMNYVFSGLHLLKEKQRKMPKEDEGKIGEILSDMEEGLKRVQGIVSDLRTFTYPHSKGADTLPLEEVVTTALRFFSHELKDKIQVEVSISKEERVVFERNKLVQVFVGLLQNSLDAFKNKEFAGQKPSIAIQCHSHNGLVSVALRDNGSGIAPENLDKIFDPFFTTKDVGEGMGLGLSICYRILREQGGNISVKSEKGKFTEFTVEIPARV